VRNGLLAATVIIPPNAGDAIKLMASALKSENQPPEVNYTQATSFPPLTSLAPSPTTN
jgi:hypothetical protein